MSVLKKTRAEWKPQFGSKFGAERNDEKILRDVFITL